LTSWLSLFIIIINNRFINRSKIISFNRYFIFYILYLFSYLLYS